MADASPSPALGITGLRFRHRGSNGDLFELSIPAFELAAGDEVLLSGGSGSGKSTLLHLIAGLLEPDEGRIEVAGTDVHRLRGAQRDRFRGRSIGMVFQTFQLLVGFTARENVELALLFAAPGRERVGGAHERASTLLHSLGLPNPDAPVERLSVGQQQRVAVGRALAARPALVLADEPTASLDPANAERAIELLRSSCRAEGAALLVVSHDPSLADRFARTVRLEEMVSAQAAPTRGALR